MNLLDRARQDVKNITSNTATGFAKPALFTAPTGETATVNVLWSEHNLSHDLEGNRVNSKNSHLSVSESLLTDAGYPVRDASGKVALANLKQNNKHFVEVEGVVYTIRENYPSNTTGLIVCILQPFKD